MEEKLIYKLENFQKALSSFEKALSLTEENLDKDLKDVLHCGQIQKFEIVSELCWKAMRRFLLDIEGVEANTPKSAVRDFYQAGLCDEDQYEELIRMINHRNWLSHAYEEKMMQDIMAYFPGYVKLLGYCINQMKERA